MSHGSEYERLGKRVPRPTEARNNVETDPKKTSLRGNKIEKPEALLNRAMSLDDCPRVD